MFVRTENRYFSTTSHYLGTVPSTTQKLFTKSQKGLWSNSVSEGLNGWRVLYLVTLLWRATHLSIIPTKFPLSSFVRHSTIAKFNWKQASKCCEDDEGWAATRESRPRINNARSRDWSPRASSRSSICSDWRVEWRNFPFNWTSSSRDWIIEFNILHFLMLCLQTFLRSLECT